MNRETWGKVMAEFPSDLGKVRAAILRYMGEQVPVGGMGVEVVGGGNDMEHAGKFWEMHGDEENFLESGEHH